MPSFPIRMLQGFVLSCLLRLPGVGPLSPTEYGQKVSWSRYLSSFHLLLPLYPPLPVCVSKGRPFVWDPNWPSLSDGSRPVSAGRKVTALFESRLRTEPRKVKPASTDKLACDFQEPAAGSQATLEPARLRWEKLLGDKARLVTCGTEISMKSSAECVAIPSRYCID